jgi:hypothetical protein
MVSLRTSKIAVGLAFARRVEDIHVGSLWSVNSDTIKGLLKRLASSSANGGSSPTHRRKLPANCKFVRFSRLCLANVRCVAPNWASDVAEPTA